MKNELSLTESLELIAKDELSSVELGDDCQRAIGLKNKKLNAYISVNKTAEEHGSKNRKLRGVPFAVKDNFLTLGLRTTASSYVLENYIPPYNATVIQRLVDSGGVIMGKTNMDAWAHGSSTETSDFGPTRNPWNLEHLPGGSSGGSAAATAADMCIFSIGSETAGSVRGPAAWCGCVGVKPTYGRVSRYGVIAMGSSLDCPGPITKTVADSATILEIIAGIDPYDATTSPLPVPRYSDYLDKGVKGLKIAIASEYLLKDMSDAVKDSVKEAAKIFESEGAHVDYVKTLDPHLAIGVYTIVQRSEVSSNLARYDGVRYGGGRDLFGLEAKRRIMLGTFSLSTGYSDKYYKKALKVRKLFIDDFARIFSKFDLLLCPTMPGPAPKIGVTEGQEMYGEMADMLNEPSSVAGLPGISVPCGFVDNLPIGLNIITRQFAEEKLFQAASLYEQVTNWHKRKPEVKYEK